MKKWFQSLSKNLRVFLCIVTLALGGCFILLYSSIENFFLLIIGLIFIFIFILFLALNGQITKEEKFKLSEQEEEEHKKKLDECKRQGEKDAALIDADELSSAIEKLQRQAKEQEKIYDSTTDIESRKTAAYDLIYINAKLHGAIKRKMQLLDPERYAAEYGEPKISNRADSSSFSPPPKGALTVSIGINGASILENKKSYDPIRNKIDRITVIDFETANHSFNSACSIGIAVIKGLEIVDRQYYLIQPPENRYSNDNIAIHHITPQDTENADTFPAVWEKIKQYFSDTYLAAHNANFDMSVLKATLHYYGLEQPSFRYVDTMSVSGYAIPRGAGIARSLAARCAYFNIPLENHHNALADAEAAAQLILCNVATTKYQSAPAFLEWRGDFKDYADVELKDAALLGNSSRFKSSDVHEIAATTAVNEEKDADFDGKTFVITGEFKTMTREEALSIVVARGGIIKSGVSSKVDILVNADDRVSTKTKKAEELQSAGHHIKIVNENQFMRMLESNDAINLDE